MTKNCADSSGRFLALCRHGVLSLVIGSALVSTNALADHTELEEGDTEIVSQRFDGPISSRALNGNSQLEDVSADGRYIAFSTEAGVASASVANPKSLIYDRLTDEVELFDPAPGARTGNLMFSDNGQTITFLSDSMDLGGAPVETGTQPNFDLFEFDRATNSTQRLTTGFNFRIRQERETSLGSEEQYVLLQNGTGSDSRPGWYLYDKYTSSISEVLYPTASRAVIAGSGTAFAYYRLLGNVWSLGWQSNSFSAQPVQIEADTSFELVSISYDGQNVVYPKRLADGTQALYLYNVPTGRKDRLLPNANGNLRRAAFSEDNQHLLIESTATNLTGSFDPKWSRRGSICYESGNRAGNTHCASQARRAQPLFCELRRQCHRI